VAEGDKEKPDPAAEQDPAEGGAPVGDQPEPVSQDPQDFVLSRELFEIYLLLDNISANPDTTISALAARQDRPKGLDEDWIDQVTKITWPPDGSKFQRSEQASLLIKAKDYLNQLSKPASGLTVAFTHLVTQEDDFTPPELSSAQPLHMDNTMSRGVLACVAYPDLVPTAKRFRKVQRWINWILVSWLVFTCFTSWWVAYGNDSLREFAAATKQLEDAQTRVNAREAGLAGAVDSSKDEGQAPDADEPKTEPTVVVVAPAVPGEEVGYCLRFTLRSPKEGELRPELPRWENAEQRQACRALWESRKQVKQSETRLGSWLGPVLRWLLSVDPNEQGDASSTAARLTAVLGGAVLPILYGFLGAGASILRSVSRKIKSSTLNPRDLSLLLQQLALGAVVGACIGLFIGQPGEGASLIGPVALSASAISFVAGFGVDSVFQALEALISRIFNIAPAGGQPEQK